VFNYYIGGVHRPILRRMPPKNAPSKKIVQKEKQKKIEELTFGLKNKNKSAKVQQYVQSMEKNVLNTGTNPRQRQLDEQKKQAKLAAKAAKKAMEAERDALFNEALLAVSKKTAHDSKAGKIESKGRDADDNEVKKQTSSAMKMMYQMDAKEMRDKLHEDPSYVPTLEDEVEIKRQQMFEELRKSGKSGTPVTEETLKIWLDKKGQKRAEEAKKLVEAELRKRKGGKGLSVLSGRDLYEYNKELFVDDDDAADEQETTRLQEACDNSVPSINDIHNIRTNSALELITKKVDSELFLEGEEDDLEDLEDD